MMTVEVEIIGLRDLLGRFARFDRELMEHHLDELDRFGDIFIGMLSDHAPVGKTGKFAESFVSEANFTGGGFELTFESTDPRAEAIMGPTKPHTITAVRAKKLRFWKGETKVFARSVEHPGTDEADFVEEAFIAGEPLFIRSMNRAGVRAMIYLAGGGD